MLFIITFQFGIFPTLNNTKSKNSKSAWTHLNLSKDDNLYDVVIFGENPDGIAAAIGSARAGAKTLLIAEGKDLGGSVVERLTNDLEPAIGTRGFLLNKGFFKEIYDKTFKNFTYDDYYKYINTAVNKEKNLSFLFSAALKDVKVENETLKGINIFVDNDIKTIKAQRFIDSTTTGKLLRLCKVPYKSGFEDIGLKDTWPLANVNFIVSGVDPEKIQDRISEEKKQKEEEIAKEKENQVSNQNAGQQENQLEVIIDSTKINSKTTHLKLTDFLQNYECLSVFSKLNKFESFDLKNGYIQISGLGMYGVNFLNEKILKQKQLEAEAECKALVEMLAKDFEEFKKVKIEKIGTLYSNSPIHFEGEFKIGINEALENTYYTDTIAMSAGKLTVNTNNQTTDVLGNSKEFSIPLGCVIPKKIDNLLMTGDKISVSSLVTSTISKMSCRMAIGQAVGAYSVLSINKGMSTRNQYKLKTTEFEKELNDKLTGLGMELPKFEVKNSNVDNWCYKYVRKLNEYGLITGGEYNDYQFSTFAIEGEMTLLLINGASRVAPNKYNLDIDYKLRKYLTDSLLTPEAAASMLIILHGKEVQKWGNYELAMQYGYINKEADARMKKRLLMQELIKRQTFANEEDKVNATFDAALRMEDVYFLVGRNLELYAK